MLTESQQDLLNVYKISRHRIITVLPGEVIDAKALITQGYLALYDIQDGAMKVEVIG